MPIENSYAAPQLRDSRDLPFPTTDERPEHHYSRRATTPQVHLRCTSASARLLHSSKVCLLSRMRLISDMRRLQAMVAISAREARAFENFLFGIQLLDAEAGESI